MGRLKDIAKKSTLMKIDIDFNGEEIKFNLFRELAVDENLIAEEIKNHTSNYALLSMLHKKFIKRVKDLKLDLTKTEAELYKKYKTQPGEGNRAKSKDLAMAEVESDKTYLIKSKKLVDAEYHRDIIETCVRGFETRKDLLQTISANLRREVS